jgi:hypothetical protein
MYTQIQRAQRTSFHIPREDATWKSSLEKAPFLEMRKATPLRPLAERAEKPCLPFHEGLGFRELMQPWTKILRKPKGLFCLVLFVPRVHPPREKQALPTADALETGK